MMENVTSTDATLNETGRVELHVLVFMFKNGSISDMNSPWVSVS
jgi:hypothetical protein